ncbi:MAG: PilN domain-containing protein [Bdellovibrionales bacterium]|jgi:Tfp pilus assembly protein PilN|nr:PilN domain-containing protein [Bdellovibrionales bacterium]
MIRVNLLGAQTTSEQANVIAPTLDGMAPSEIQRQVIVRVLVLILIPAALFIYESITIPKLRAKKESITNSIVELQAFNQKADRAVREIKKFQEDEKKIKKQIEIIQTLSKDRLREIQILDLFQQVIPERVWLKELEFTKTKLSLRGQAMTDSDIASFIEALSRSVFLNDVQPSGTTEAILDGQKIRDFEISAKLEKDQ